jgi:hypothetical protein
MEEVQPAQFFDINKELPSFEKWSRRGKAIGFSCGILSAIVLLGFEAPGMGFLFVFIWPLTFFFGFGLGFAGAYDVVIHSILNNFFAGKAE